MTLTPKRLYLVVAACAVVVYLGALKNGFALDDVSIIAANPLVHRWAGLRQAFLEPYWPVSLGAAMYRPLAMVSYVIDWHLGQAAWLHGVNLLWHAGVSVAVAWLVRRWTGSAQGALLAGLVFALHPVHVEAVANIVGRAELMGALFTLLSVYAALEGDHLWWSLLAFALGLLSKENAAVAPALIALGWLAGLGRPARRRMLAYGSAWAGLGVAYFLVRWGILHTHGQLSHVAAVFVGASPAAVRLTAVAALADVVRLLVFPLTLRADYSVDERTLVTTPLDPRFALGLSCLALWALLLAAAWRRGRRVEAFGLGWIAIAHLPVANLLFPTGVLVAERTLYLPSVGFAIALGAWLKDQPPRRLALPVAAVLLAGAVRTALRVPVWFSSRRVGLSVLEDSPRSFVGPAWMIGIYLAEHQPEKALQAFRVASSITDRAPLVYLSGADAALKLGRSTLADSLLARLDQLCYRCLFYYEFESQTALIRGDSAVADSFRARARQLAGRSPRP